MYDNFKVPKVNERLINTALPNKKDSSEKKNNNNKEQVEFLKVFKEKLEHDNNSKTEDISTKKR